VLKFLRGVIWFASAFVVLLLCTSSYDYLVAALPDGPPQSVFILTYVVGAVSLLAAVPVHSWIHAIALVAPRLVRPCPDHHLWAESATRGDRAVNWCVRIAIAYLAVAALSDAIALSVSDWWNHARPDISYIVAWGSLALPLAVLVMALRALAPDSDHRDAVPENQQSGIQHAAEPSEALPLSENGA